MGFSPVAPTPGVLIRVSLVALAAKRGPLLDSPRKALGFPENFLAQHQARLLLSVSYLTREEDPPGKLLSSEFPKGSSARACRRNRGNRQGWGKGLRRSSLVQALLPEVSAAVPA